MRPVDALIKEVLLNHIEDVVFVLNYIRAEHPHTFESRGHSNNTALLASTEPQVSPLIMRILLQPEYQIYVGYLGDQSLSGETALHLCVMCDQEDNTITQREDAVRKARMLLQHGADVESVSRHIDKTPLDLVGSVDMATVLFEYGAGPGINDISGLGDGDTVLNKSITDGNIELAALLLQRGADIDLETGYYPPLHAAIRQGDRLNDDDMDIDMFEFLVENGANFWSVDGGGRTLRQRARDQENRYAFRLIELIIAEVNIETTKWTPENIDKTIQSVIMSQHHRDVPKAGLCRMTPEIIQHIIHNIKQTIPVNIEVYVMHNIKRRNNGRFPIQDSD
jgi:ankyrin repeat protein